jgi:hypothetical protein
VKVVNGVILSFSKKGSTHVSLELLLLSRLSAINTILNRPLSNPTAGPPPPSAADYVPSAAFLQNMTSPQNSVVYPKSVPEYLGR